MAVQEAINTKEIMEDIRRKIKEEGLTSTVLSFDEVDVPDPIASLEGGYDKDVLQFSTEYMSSHYQIAPIRPIPGNPLKAAIKKLMRKLVNFYILPIVTEQNALNYHFATAIMQFNGYVHKNAEIEPVALDRKINEMEIQRIGTRYEVDMLIAQVDELKAEVAELKKKCGMSDDSVGGSNGGSNSSISAGEQAADSDKSMAHGGSGSTGGSDSAGAGEQAADSDKSMARGGSGSTGGKKGRNRA